MTTDADSVIASLGLEPHPEGGRYKEIYRHASAEGGRGAVTSIYYLLRAGETSAWHRVDATEIWHFYDGAPLRLSISHDGAAAVSHILGTDLAAGQAPQLVVPADAWQSAESLGEWTLAGCIVAPAFEFDGFELAPTGWRPGDK